MRPALRSGILLALATVRAAHAADEITPWGSLAGVYSDNTQYTSSGATGAAAIDALAGLRVRHSSTSLFVNADLSALYRYFPGGSFGSQFLPAAQRSRHRDPVAGKGDVYR